MKAALRSTPVFGSRTTAEFYSYIYARDRAEAFNNPVEYLTSTKSINYVDSISISDASKF